MWVELHKTKGQFSQPICFACLVGWVAVFQCEHCNRIRGGRLFARTWTCELTLTYNEEEEEEVDIDNGILMNKGGGIDATRRTFRG